MDALARKLFSDGGVLGFFPQWSKAVTEAYNTLWKMIIRPPRATYSMAELGPNEFQIKDEIFERHDMQVFNDRGLKLECSHFRPAKRSPNAEEEPLPCVIYAHGNRSSRLEVVELLPELLHRRLTVFALDLSGSGLSEGEYISLGYYEEQDLKAVIRTLRESGRVTSIGLWGRSMGAVTSIFRAAEDWSLAALVLDSPFSNLPAVAQELVLSQTSIPQFVLNKALQIVRKEVKTRANFDIEDLLPIRRAPHCRSPALFAVGKDDTFILPHHTYDLYSVWGGNERKVVTFSGGHNTRRPDWFIEEAANFMHKKLLVAAARAPPPTSKTHSTPSEPPQPRSNLKAAALAAQKAASTPEPPPPSLTDKLRGFRAQGMFKKAVLYIIAGQIDGRIEVLRNVFAKLDGDGDGVLTKAELNEGLTKAGFQEIPPDLKEAFAHFDADAGDVFDYAEFLAATLERREYLQEAACRAAFRILDQDGDGKVTEDDLFDTMGPDAPAALREAGCAGDDGTVNFDRFMRMLRGTGRGVVAESRQGNRLVLI